MVKSIDDGSLAGPVVPHRLDPLHNLRFRPGVRTLEMGLLMQGSTAEHSGLLVDDPERKPAMSFCHFLTCLAGARNSWIQRTILVYFGDLHVLLEVAQLDRDCHGNRDLVNRQFIIQLIRKVSKPTSIGDSGH